MKALLCTAFGPPDQLVVRDVPVPEPAPQQLRIDVKAASLNYPDVLLVQGLYQVKPPLPFTPGTELAGVVSAVGAGCVRFRIGDRVVAAALGGFAEEALVDEARVAALPDGMAFDTAAAFFVTYCTSLRALHDRARVQPGETVLVLGAAGGVGTAAIEIAKAMGARVLAAASSEAKLAVCRTAGADATIDYTREKLREAIAAFTGGRGIDVVYDPVGGEHTEAALRCMAWGGRLLVIGFASGTIPKVPLNLALLAERSITGVYWGESLAHDPDAQARNIEQLLSWHVAGRINPLISERVPLAAAAAALSRMQQRLTTGKVVVLPEA